MSLWLEILIAVAIVVYLVDWVAALWDTHQINRLL